MKHALTRLREEYRALADTYARVKVDPDFKGELRSLMIRELMQEMKDTREAIALIEDHVKGLEDDKSSSDN